MRKRLSFSCMFVVLVVVVVYLHLHSGGDPSHFASERHFRLSDPLVILCPGLHLNLTSDPTVNRSPVNSAPPGTSGLRQSITVFTEGKDYCRKIRKKQRS